MKVLVISSFILVASMGMCMADGNAATVGKDFIFTFFNAFDLDEEPHGVVMYAIVSNNNNGAASVTVTSPYRWFSTIKVSVAPLSVLKIPITPWSIEAQYTGNTSNDRIVVEDKGIRLVSSLPVSVYAHIELNSGQSADSFLVLPAVHLGTEYVAVTSMMPFKPNMIAVVAYEDNTQVTFQNQMVTLNALQVASVATQTYLLSGSKISGNKPFAAISGCTVGIVEDSDDYEALMLLPVGNWGKEFFAIPFMQLTTNYYQVVANTDATVVYSGTTPIAVLQAGEYKKIQTPATMISSNNPIQLIQLGQNLGAANGRMGDPFFLPLPSTDKLSNTSVLYLPTGFIPHDEYTLVYMVRIVTDIAGTGSIQLDGMAISALQFKRVPNSAYYYYDATVRNTTHSVRANNPATKFLVISYTYGYHEGCGFVCGFSLPVGNRSTVESADPSSRTKRNVPDHWHKKQLANIRSIHD